MDHTRTSAAETISLAGCTSSLSKPWKQREGAFAFDRRELPIMVDLLKSAAAKVIGAEKVNEFNQIMPGGDDAAYFRQKVPGVYWILGARNEAKGFVQPGQSHCFDFDEDALSVGAAVQAQALTDFLLAP